MSRQGRWRVVVVLAAFTQFFVTAGPVYNYNVFFVDLREEFQKSAVITGWVGSLGSALYCAVVPLAAIVASKIGNLPLVLIGTIMASAGYLATSFIPTLEYAYLTFGILVGLGSSLANCAAGSLVLDWFSGREDNCRATGGAIMGTSFGVMVFGPVLTTLSAHYGWRNCLRILSGIVLVVGLAGSLPFAKSVDGQRTKLNAEQPDQIDGPHSTGENRSPATCAGGEVDQVAGCADESESVTEQTVEVKTGPLRLLVNTDTWLWVSSISLAQFGWSFVILNFSSFMKGIGLSSDDISLALFIFGAAEVAVKILFTVFGDRLPCLKLYVIVVGATGGAIISGFLTLCSTFQHMIILATAWGMFRGAIYGACFAAGDELFMTYGARSVTSIVLLGFGLGILLSPITEGLYDLTGDYTLSLSVLIGTFMMSAFCMILIPAKKRLPFCRLLGHRDRPAIEDDTISQTDAVGIVDTPASRLSGRTNLAYEVQI